MNPIAMPMWPGTEQFLGLSRRFPVLTLGSKIDETSGAFMGTAALMQTLDLIVTSDTAIAHLAGALGRSVWMAVSFTPDWRWLRDRDNSSWYPTMRLFRQPKLGDWQSVFERIAGELKMSVAAGSGARSILVEVPVGELVDKITILEIKNERMTDPDKLRNVRTELAALVAVRDRELPRSEKLAELTARLKGVNEALWEIEDEIRACERNKDFGARFVELARSVYHQNDQRSTIKRSINELLGSKLIEEKSYTRY